MVGRVTGPAATREVTFAESVFVKHLEKIPLHTLPVLLSAVKRVEVPCLKLVNEIIKKLPLLLDQNGNVEVTQTQLKPLSPLIFQSEGGDQPQWDEIESVTALLEQLSLSKF